MSNNEDASVYKLNDELALVQSVDFIAPILNSAYHYGAIAAANALSDIFAMGASVLNALNIVCFDAEHFETKLLAEVLAGANDKVVEAGGVTLGGHSVNASDFFFGLSVTGKVHPKKFWRNNTAKEGDMLILTKPVGSGVLNVMAKANVLSSKRLKALLDSLMQLNLYAAKIAANFHPSAVTDLSGFALAGHALEMCNDKLSLELVLEEVPLYEGVEEGVQNGLIPASAYNNELYFSPRVKGEAKSWFYDPQSSGGLLIAINPARSISLLHALQDSGIKAAIIGCFFKKGEKDLVLA